MFQMMNGSDFGDVIQQVSASIVSQKDSVATEEATKMAMVMPFIAGVLGYNVFNPNEVVPEYTADVGTKKGEKVDYAICSNGNPIVLIECKRNGIALNGTHTSQLYRYFSVTNARFGIITNGTMYRFYSDIDEPNKMDEHPFLELDMTNPDSIETNVIRLFHKDEFDPESILAKAKNLKYTRYVLQELQNEWHEISDDMAMYFAGRIHNGRKTKRVVDEFKTAVANGMRQFVATHVSHRLDNLLNPTHVSDEDEIEDDGIFTTEEEWQLYYAVKAIVAPVVDVERVSIRDFKHSCSVLLDNSTSKPIVKMYFNTDPKKIQIFDTEEDSSKIVIENVNHVYQYFTRLQDSVRRYIDTDEGVTGAV